MILRLFFRWRHHVRKRRRSREVLSGRREVNRYAIFTKAAFRRPRFGKYDPRVRRHHSVKVALVLVLPLLIWVAIVSYRGLFFFQP